MFNATRETRRKEEDRHSVAPGKMAKAAEAKTRRAAFGDITNAVKTTTLDGTKKVKQTGKCGPKKAAAATKSKVPAAVPAVKKAEAKSQAVSRKTENVKPKAATVVSEKEAAKPETEIVSSGTSVDDDADISMVELEHSLTEEMGLNRSQANIELNPVELPEMLLQEGVENVDLKDASDVTLAALYVYDIFKYYKSREARFSLEPYLDQQPFFSASMRAVLVDWLVEVQENFELNHETLYLAVKLVDNYMSRTPRIPRENVQLVGAVALFLASKFDERLAPAIDDFLYVCDHAYTRDQFTAMEIKIFTAADYDLGRPISYRFLRRYARCAKAEVKTLYLARYLIELSLMEYRFIFHRDSLLAAAALYIAMRTLNDKDWTPTVQFYTGYSVSDLQSVALQLHSLFVPKKNRNSLQTIREKYKHPLFHSVGHIPAPTTDHLFPKDLNLSASSTMDL